MRANPKTLKQYRRVIKHRILQPRIWNAFVESRISSLSDQEFFDLLRFRGTRDEFLTQFHASARLRFFFHPRNQKDFFLQLLTSAQPYEEILAEADDVLKNRFATLGSGNVELGWPINWHRDFKSGREWPLRRLTSEEILDLSNPSDIKVPWELSRFHQVWWLGKAYWLTRNEEYAQKFAELVGNWIDRNPLGKGTNWANAMESAIRACNWIAGYYFFCESKSLSSEFWIRFLKSLYAHGRFIVNHLEVSWQNGNHFLSNIVGLIFLGTFFRDARFGKKWLQWGVTHLQQEMEEQVYPDGVDYEKSTSYHRLVLEFFYSATILCQKNSIKLAKPFMERLEKMFEFVEHYTRLDGSIPLVGDADDGRLFRFSMVGDVNDHRHALSVGALLFERRDFREHAGTFSQDALWFFGGEGFEKHQLLRSEPAPLRSRAFPDGGFYSMRTNSVHVFIDAGDLGMKGHGGHGHNDTFSFELWIKGAPLIVDSGTYAYTFDPKARQEFRSTCAHNALMIDREELAEFANLWKVKEDRTQPRVLRWETSDDRDLLEAKHHAYAHRSVLHRRLVELQKHPFKLIITDTLQGTGHHVAESFLHFAPGISLEVTGEHLVTAKREDDVFLISASGGELSIRDTRFSRSYGVVEPNKTLCLTAKKEFPTVTKFEIRHERSTP